MKLRPYQEASHARLDEAVIDRGEKSSILALPTGSGKTFTAASWAHKRFLQHGCSLLWFVHRIELLDQARKTFARIAPDIRVTEWTADTKDDSGRIVLAMILSAKQLTRDFDMIVIDEAHHAAMPTYRSKLEELNYDFLLGLTATPTRLDGKNLGFESIAAQYSVLDLVQEGFLAKPTYVKIKTGQKHRMRVRAGEFTGKSLRQLDNLERNQLVAKIWADQHDDWGPTLIFCADIEHSEHLKAAIDEKVAKLELSPHTATVVHSKMPAKTRAARVARFQQGMSKVLINVGVFTEGFDAPHIRSVFMTRPTASETLYLQMIGRGTRITEDKDGFYVVDFVDEIGKYALLANRWAVEHLGAEDEEEGIRSESECEAAIDKLQNWNIDPRLLAEVQREFVSFGAMAEWQGKYDKQIRVAALTNEQLTAYHKLKIAFDDGVDPRTAIEGMYTWANIGDSGMKLSLWKSFGWACFFNHIKQFNRAAFRILEFRKTELDRAALRQEIRDDSAEHAKLNTQMADAKWKHWLKECLNYRILSDMGIPDFVSDLTYHNGIVKVVTKDYRQRTRGSDRALVRELITHETSELLDIPVELVLKWAD